MSSTLNAPKPKNRRISKEKGPSVPAATPDRSPLETAWMTAGRFWSVGGPSVGLASPAPAEPMTAYRLITSAVHEAVNSLSALELGIRDAADAYRWQAPAEANRRFLAIVEGLRLLASVTDMAASATGLNLGELCEPDGGGPLDEMGSALDQLTAEQFAEDWSAVAITLDEQLLPSLAGWREVLSAILMQADFRFRDRRPQ